MKKRIRPNRARFGDVHLTCDEAERIESSDAYGVMLQKPILSLIPLVPEDNDEDEVYEEIRSRIFYMMNHKHTRNLPITPHDLVKNILDGLENGSRDMDFWLMEEQSAV